MPGGQKREEQPRLLFMYLFIYLLHLLIKKVLGLQTILFVPPPTLQPISLSSKSMAGIHEKGRRNLKSRYLRHELLLDGAEAQSIMGEMPICAAKLELISWHIAPIVRQKTQVLRVGP